MESLISKVKTDGLVSFRKMHAYGTDLAQRLAKLPPLSEKQSLLTAVQFNPTTGIFGDFANTFVSPCQCLANASTFLKERNFKEAQYFRSQGIKELRSITGESYSEYLTKKFTSDSDFLHLAQHGLTQNIFESHAAQKPLGHHLDQLRQCVAADDTINFPALKNHVLALISLTLGPAFIRNGSELVPNFRIKQFQQFLATTRLFELAKDGSPHILNSPEIIS